jgi:hypothetical protein
MDFGLSAMAARSAEEFYYFLNDGLSFDHVQVQHALR